MSEETLIAVFVDYENLAIGARESRWRQFKIDLIMKRLLEKGRIVYKRAYCDWSQYPGDVREFHSRGIELVDIPRSKMSGKNSADIRMVVDALDLCYSKDHIEVFALLTGDSDFSSLVLKLKEYGKYVIGVGIQESTSDILVQNCDEYYSYTSLTGLTKTTELGANARDPWVLVKDAVAKMVARGDVMRSDRLKQVMQELDPSFDESSMGFSKFSKFLAEASSRGLVSLKKLENGLLETQENLQGLETRTLRWILVATVGITLLAVWMAAGQAAMCLLGWTGLRRTR